ncbi:hypothetical protein QIY50_17540 [Pseudomonas putida]|nr:hypothetical protein QIY50_17540 [Pseudomonas putida]
MFALEAKIIDSTIYCTIQTAKQPDDQFYFYLMRDGVTVHRSGWTSEPSFSKTLEEPGSYYIQAHLKRDDTNTLKRSGSIFFYTPSCSSELRARWSEETSLEINEPNLYTLTEPFSSFLIHYTDSMHPSPPILSTEIDPNLKKTQNLELANGSLKLYQFAEPLNSNSIMLFSGTAISKSRFIFGEADISDDLAAEDFNSSVGNFTMISQRGERVSIHTDYFGFSKIYYYKQGNNTLLSNSYHLLLKALKAAKIKLQIDYDIALSKLNFIGLQPFYQNFSRHMDVKDVICLPIDKYIYFDNEGMHVTDKSIASTLYDGRDVSN